MEDSSRNILEQLESRGVTPRPRWYFLLMRSFFWILSLVSVAVGSIAISVAWYVFFDNDGLHVSLSNLFIVIPYVWIIVLIVFIVLAYFGFRQTRRGYKYPTKVVIILLFGASIILSLVFDTLDFGQTLHKYLLSHTNFYNSLIHSREDE